MESKEFNYGFECGKEWANCFAEKTELRRLEALAERMHSDEWKLAFQEHDRQSAQAIRDWLYSKLFPDGTLCEEPCPEFWFTYTGQYADAAGDGELLRGFAEAALGLWLIVKNRRRERRTDR